MRWAAQLLGAATAVMDETGDALETLLRARFTRASRDLRDTLGESEYEQAYADGRASPDRVMTDAARPATDDLDALVDVATRAAARR